MNYIGSKLTLLPFITSSIESVVGRSVCNFADIFAGTGVVGAHFRKRGAEVIANDMQYYSYVMLRNIIQDSQKIKFSGLETIPQTNALFSDKLHDIKHYLNSLEGKEGFIYNNYSLHGTKNGDIHRMYFSDDNAKRCDAIRQTIEEWKESGLINQEEYFFLLSSLLVSIDKVANTASVYGAFLKKLKSSAAKPLDFNFVEKISSEKSGRAYNSNANELIKEIEGEVLYLDPPYNHRQYAANYHILETIARYDNPEVRGVSGLRDYSAQSSAFCKKNEASDALNDLIKNARFDYIFLSYNNEGIIPTSDIEKIFRSKGEYMCLSQDFRRYKADSNRDYKNDRTTEYLHIIKGTSKN